jgi:hypothetical protein
MTARGWWKKWAKVVPNTDPESNKTSKMRYLFVVAEGGATPELWKEGCRKERLRKDIVMVDLSRTTVMP